MRNYELTYIIHPDIQGEDASALMQLVEGWIGAQGGSVRKVSDWGMRRLAYQIKNQRDGHYIHLEVEIEPHGVAEVERNLKLNESILRHLMVRADD
jgi:small subunit ribosomal protein S6